MVAAFLFLFFYWDPPRSAFVLPWIHHPVAWYGILFACGFFLAYLLVKKIFAIRLRPYVEDSVKVAAKLTDTLTWYSVIGTVVGARLAEVFFYEWPYYSAHPWDIFKIWEGGLASHGGVLGVIVAMLYFRWHIRKTYPSLTLITILDTAVIPGALVGSFIRFGNFINQEILGVESKVPWAVLFGHPAERVPFVPRHPVQLYEACFYFCLFIFLATLWFLKKEKLKEGVCSGLFFILLFSFRFCIEWLKLPQSAVLDESFLNAGQYLSIPFILFGIFLLFRQVKSYTQTSSKINS
ncbi:MAG: prolipoprotein diacylglyceryl transferase [Chlamydiales bacterium]|nr:prolipoprotein diacylglyceryl transferase [Chlamydiales bacterium]